jgi:hypothetical protein
MSPADIEELRETGFSDQNIFDAVVIVAYFNFMNRIADGLGVVPERERQESYERHMREVVNNRQTAASIKPLNTNGAPPRPEETDRSQETRQVLSNRDEMEHKQHKHLSCSEGAGRPRLPRGGILAGTPYLAPGATGGLC